VRGLNLGNLHQSNLHHTIGHSYSITDKEVQVVSQYGSAPGESKFWKRLEKKGNRKKHYSFVGLPRWAQKGLIFDKT